VEEVNKGYVTIEPETGEPEAEGVLASDVDDTMDMEEKE